ncbi:MAG: hypothetical protein BMS9Abin07_0576 [Acidimicrobiia bacterium]|nr:MAG: hypothetical protein BMS9Abin07_0576 [Acidimicrobiia bacterium]
MPGIPFIGLLVVGGLIAVVVMLATRAQTRAIRERWVQAAEQLGFTMMGTAYRGLSMSGSEGALQAKVDVYSKSSGTSSSTYTRYRVEFPPLGLGLGLSRQAGWQGLVRALGGQDVEIDDATFDERFVVKADSPELARRFFTPGRVGALNTLFDRHPGFILSNDELRFETRGMAKEPERIVSTVNNLMTAARTLQPAESLGTVEPTESATRDEELQRVFETIAEYAEEEAPKEPARDVEGAPAPAADTDALLVASRLFGENQLDFEVKRIFNDEFHGRSVDWSGTVKRQAGLMATHAFEADNRTALVVEVASLEDELYGRTAIDAIVAFPNDAAPQPGETVRFTGRLIKVDGVSKDLYVADGRLS